MLHDLLARDLTAWNGRSAPHTKALNDQKMIGGDSLVRFWLDCLSTSCIVGLGEEGLAGGCARPGAPSSLR